VLDSGTGVNKTTLRPGFITKLGSRFKPIFPTTGTFVVPSMFIAPLFEFKVTEILLITTLLPIVIIPDKTENAMFGALKFILSRNKSPLALIFISVSDVTKPPSSVKLPAHANEAPSSNDAVKLPEQFVFVILEVEAAFVIVGRNASKHMIYPRRNIELSTLLEGYYPSNLRLNVTNR
jgi:hypothetical protein